MIQRLIIILCASTVCTSLCAQYNFNFACTDDTIQEGIDFMEFHFLLENTGVLPDSYAFDCRLIDSIPGWFEQFCIGGACAEPGTILYDHLDAGEVDSAITIQVYPTPGIATEVLNLHVQSIGNPLLQDSINVYAVGVNGIEEDEQNNNNSAIFEIYPNPFAHLTNIRFGIGHNQKVDSRYRPVISIKIHSATGRLIKEFSRFTAAALQPALITWDGRDNAGKEVSNGIYFIQIEQNGSKKTAKIIRFK